MELEDTRRSRIAPAPLLRGELLRIGLVLLLPLALVWRGKHIRRFSMLHSTGGGRLSNEGHVIVCYRKWNFGSKQGEKGSGSGCLLSNLAR